MKRAECIKALYPEFEDCLVVTIMGACAQELYDLGHRENFFYLQHAMGLASSIGLGLALSLPNRRTVVLDGDGSVLMNLGTLTTIARYRPANLIHIIFDNGSLLSTGGFLSPTARRPTNPAALWGGAPGWSCGRSRWRAAWPRRRPSGPMARRRRWCCFRPSARC